MEKRICPSCRQVVYGDAKTCPYCREPLTYGRPYDRKKHKIVIGICVCIGVVVIGSYIAMGAFFYNIWNTWKEAVVKDEVAPIDYDTEGSVVEPKVHIDDEIASPDEVKKSVGKIVDAYNQGTFTYEDALQKVEELDIDEDSSDYKEAMVTLEKLQESKVFFENGVSCEKTKQYANAYEEYKKVWKEDTKYKEAQNAMKRVKKALNSKH